MQTTAQERREPEATLPSRQGERLLKLPGWSSTCQGQGSFSLAPHPVTCPLVPPRQAQQCVRKARVGECILTGCKHKAAEVQALHRGKRPGQGVHQRSQGWPDALRQCQSQFQGGSSLASWGTQFMLFLVRTLQWISASLPPFFCKAPTFHSIWS